MPRETQVNNMDVPPILINGRGCPVTGRRLTPTPIFIKDWKMSIKLNPKTKCEANLLSTLFIILIALKKRIIYKNNSPTPPTIEPNSSIEEAYIKSDWAEYKSFLTWPFPGPFPNKKPFATALFAISA